MSWLKRLTPARIRTDAGAEPRKRNVPEGLWEKCDECGTVLYARELEENLQVCPRCGHHMPIRARARLAGFLDAGPLHEIGAALGPVDGVEVVPDPPQTPMFHLLLRGDREGLADAALTLAEERGVFLFGDPSTTTSPSVQLVEVMVGEPTLRIDPDEAAALLGEVVERASA